MVKFSTTVATRCFYSHEALNLQPNNLHFSRTRATWSFALSEGETGTAKQLLDS